jgi:hypothetical protein
MKSPPNRALLIFCLLACMNLFMSCSRAESPNLNPTLRPYVARYNVRYHGLSGGDIEFTLKNEGNGRYVFASHLLPNFLGRFFTSDQAEDRSEMSFANGELKPLHFVSEDGTSKTDNDLRYDFDWATRKATGRFREHDFTLNLPANTQDRLSIQLAASLALQAGHEPGKLIMLERDELQEYHITEQGKEHISTKGGDYDTVLLKSEREGSSRTTQYWYAPALNYIPVRAERSTNGKVDIVMELKSYRAL